MRRRDFLALCAAAVGCAAVPVKAAMKTNGGWWIHCQDATWANPVWHLMQYDGEKWVDMGPADLKYPGRFPVLHKPTQIAFLA